MNDSTRPTLVLYVCWHPSFGMGAGHAEGLREHFRRKEDDNVAGDTGLSVIFRSTAPEGSAVPLPIDLGESRATAVIILADSNLASDPLWADYVKRLAAETEEIGLHARLFLVTFERAALKIGLDEQALRWDRWSGSALMLRQRLTRELTYEFCRMLRHYLEHLRRPAVDEDDLDKYLQKVQIFLSHSKHDSDGERIATLVRDELHNTGHGFTSFFDVHDIPAGLRFQKVLLKQVKLSAVVAIHTDSYSSREWCRREIIEAKRWNVPLVVANCITDWDQRGFPYLGNVPIVRMDAGKADRIEVIIGRLLDEVLKNFLWRCRVVIEGDVGTSVVFVPRPPELISLAGLPPLSEVPELTIVYPDPPLSREEERLFAIVGPRVKLRSLNEWLAGAER